MPCELNKFSSFPDPRTQTWFLCGSMTPLIIILATYLYFCMSAGPRFMKNRKPFDLKNLIIAYNAIQVVLSCVIVYEVSLNFLEEMFNLEQQILNDFKGLAAGWWNDYNFRCQPVDYSMDPKSIRMARAVWFYYMCKLTELLDTIFFVLRKKQRQVSGLHLYHHTMMPICSFIGVKYFPGETSA
jgi:elongation of very long chain fatty acids protein 7